MYTLEYMSREEIVVHEGKPINYHRKELVSSLRILFFFFLMVIFGKDKLS